jgi:1-phosphatidylinositol-4-phosphate 5-kinase
MAIDGISPTDIKASLSLEQNRSNVFEAGEGEGMSGSFFFYSSDKKFIIKTLRGKEKKILLNMLDDFIYHLFQNNNESLIAKIYGVFTIKTDRFAPLDFMIMENTVRTGETNSKVLFDLKGSTFKRLSKLKVEDLNWRKKMNCSKVLKDLNWLKFYKEMGSCLMDLQPENIAKFNNIIQRDSKFLASKGLMDYSLLLAIESQGKSLLSLPASSLIKSVSSVFPSEDISFSHDEYPT